MADPQSFYDPDTHSQLFRIHGHEYRLCRDGTSFRLWIDGALQWLSLDELRPYEKAFGSFLQAILDETSTAKGICPRSGDPIDPHA